MQHRPPRVPYRHGAQSTVRISDSVISVSWVEELQLEELQRCTLGDAPFHHTLDLRQNHEAGFSIANPKVLQPRKQHSLRRAQPPCQSAERIERVPAPHAIFHDQIAHVGVRGGEGHPFRGVVHALEVANALDGRELGARREDATESGQGGPVPDHERSPDVFVRKATCLCDVGHELDFAPGMRPVTDAADH